MHLAGGLFSGQGITAAAIGQIVFSATATGDAERVRFVVGGAPAEVPRGSGEPTAAPVTRADYEALLPGH